MKNDCEKWKDPLLDAALTGIAAHALEEHVLNCADCTADLAELRARRERLNTLLPLLAQEAEPSVDFRARVLAAAEAARETSRRTAWPISQWAAAMAAIVAVLVIGFTLYRNEVRTSGTVPQNELEAAQKLSEWRAPSDVLLETPGPEILRTTPRLGESYMRVPAKTDKEE
jgi:anti-sigma factor RsiW